MNERSRDQQFRKIADHYSNGFQACALELTGPFLEEYPDDEWGWYYRGLAMLRFARLDEAREALLRSVELSVSETLRCMIYASLGDLCFDALEWDEGIKWYARCIKIEPDNAGHRIKTGFALAKQGKHHEAELPFREAIRCSQGAIDEAYYDLGWVLAATERYAEALECFEKALELDPDYGPAKIGLEDMRQCLAL